MALVDLEASLTADSLQSADAVAVWALLSDASSDSLLSSDLAVAHTLEAALSADSALSSSVSLAFYLGVALSSNSSMAANLSVVIPLASALQTDSGFGVASPLVTHHAPANVPVPLPVAAQPSLRYIPQQANPPSFTLSTSTGRRRRDFDS